MNTIQAISGQEYVDMYASDAKIALLKQARANSKASGESDSDYEESDDE